MNEEETSKALWSHSVLRREGSLASTAQNEGVDFGRSRADGLVLLILGSGEVEVESPGSGD
jgi:hypothetical protein